MSLTGTGGNAIVNTNGNAVTLSGVLSGTGGLTKAGAGTLTLSAANTYTGLTTVSAGMLAYGANDVIYTGNVTVSGGTLSLGSYSDSVGIVTLTNGAITGGTLTSTSGFAVQSGSVSAVLAGSVGLAKTATSTVILSGVNVYTGTTTVSGGILLAATPASLPRYSSSSSISVASGAAVGGYIASSGYWSEADFATLRTRANGPRGRPWPSTPPLALTLTPAHQRRRNLRDRLDRLDETWLQQTDALGRR